MAQLLNETRQAVLAGEFQRAERLLHQVPDWLSAHPPGERLATAERVLEELQQWLQLTHIHRSHLATEWAELRLKHRYGQGRHSEREVSRPRHWDG